MTDAEQDNPKLPTPVESAAADPGDIGDLRRTNIRVIGMAVVFLAAFALAIYAMQATRSGAVIVVEADEVATVYMKTGGITLHEVDGPLILTLQPHRNAVRAGKFRVEGGFAGVDLEFSTGRLLDIKKNDVIQMKITSHPRE